MSNRTPPDLPASFATLEDFERSEFYAWMCGELEAGRATIENVRVRSDAAQPVTRLEFVGEPMEER